MVPYEAVAQTELINIVDKYSVSNANVELWICPTCNEPENFRLIICCGTCDLWYHWDYVGIDTDPPVEEQWFCQTCQN